MALPATDNFNRADAATLGANWTTPEGDHHVFTNAVYASGNDSWSYWNADTFPDDQYSQASVPALSNAGVGVRISGTGPLDRNGYELVFYSASADNVVKRVAGGYTVLGNVTSDYAVSDVARIEVTGTTITVKKNGSANGTWTDASLTTGKAGINSYGDSGVAIIDDWEGGSTSAGGGYQRWGLENGVDAWQLEAGVDYWITEASTGTGPNSGPLAGTSTGPQGAVAGGQQTQAGTVAGSPRGNGAVVGTESQVGTLTGSAKGNGAVLGGSQISPNIGTIAGSALGNGAVAGTELVVGTAAGSGLGSGAIAGTESQSGAAAGTSSGGGGRVLNGFADTAGTIVGTALASGVVTGLSMAQTATIAGEGRADGAVDGTEAQTGTVGGGAGGPAGEVTPSTEIIVSGGSAGGGGEVLLVTQSMIGTITGGYEECGQELEIMINQLRLARLSEQEPLSMRIAIEEIVDKMNELIRKLNPSLP